MKAVRSLAALALALLLVPAAAHAEERANVPEKYTWNLADMYASDDAWQQARTDLAQRIPQLARFQGKLGDSADQLFAALDERMKLERDLSQLAVYASMQSDQDTRDQKHLAMDQASQKLGVDYGAAIAYMRPEILALGPDKVHGFVTADARLKPYAIWLDDIVRWAPHTLSPAEEMIVAKSGDLAAGGAAVYNVFHNADFPYPEITLANGDKVRLDAQAYTKYRQSTNRDDRLSVFHAFFAEQAKYANSFGAMLNAQMKAHAFERDVHKFNSSLEAALFRNNIPTTVYTQLLADVHANLPTLHRYLKLRQRMMGLDTLRYEDLYAPIVSKVDLHYTPEQAQEMVLAAVAPLGHDYVSTLKGGFANRWVDWMPTTGKRSGAYSTGVYGVHPYQLQNFTGLYDEVSTVAHESGHSMHTYLAAKAQPYVTADYATFVAEVASTLNEALLLDYMLDRTKDKNTRLFLLGSRLENLRTTLFRQTMFAEFEMKAHELADKGEPLTGENLDDLYLNLVRDYYGDADGVCKVNDLYKIEWAYIPHFYYDFYVYQYATSMVASSSLANDILKEAGRKATPHRDAYLTMLASGSSKYPIDLLRDAGVDMTTPQPFTKAMTEMNRVMDEMEALLKK